MKCDDCPYRWADGEGELEYCHYQWNDGYAPCEVDEYENEDAVVDDGYDPGLEPDWEMLDYSDEPSFPEGELRIGKEYYDNE